MFRYGIRCLCAAVILLCLGTISAHIPEGSGSALQLYSNYTTTPPKVNGDLTDRTNVAGGTTSGTNNDEWKDAYARTIRLTDGSMATLFFANTRDSLYVGVTYPCGNNGDPNSVSLYFERGVDGGSHDDTLTGTPGALHEHAVSTTRSSPIDYSWNGSTWTSAGGAADFQTANDYFTTVYHWEFAVSLKSTKTGGLNVDSTDELGFYIAVFKNGGGGGTFHWDSTSGNPNTARGWADLRLGVKKSYSTFYASYFVNGAPTIDGKIKGGTSVFKDDPWRGSYQRSITLSNFAGSKFDATVYSLEDPSGKKFYVGMKVNDNAQNAGDYLRIYQEQAPASGATTSDFILNDGQENMLKADGNAFNGDYYWSSAAPGWILDGAADGQNGKGAFYTNHYEYELLIDYNLGPAKDLKTGNNAKMGFLFRYHDADKPAGKQDFYWEYTVNSDSVLLNETATPDVYGAIGWAGMQLGAPYVQVIFPEDDKVVEGVVNVRIYAQDENANGIDSAYFYRKSVPATKYALTRIDGQNEWSGTWNVSTLSNGRDTLVFQVGDDDGIVVERLVPLNIQNGTGSASYPTAKITSPAPGSTLSGTQTITFTRSPGTGNSLSRVTIYIDGDSVSLDTGATTYQIKTNKYKDGAHTVQLKVINDAGLHSFSPVATYQFQNSPTVTLTSPKPDSAVSGITTIKFSASAVAPAIIIKREIYIDGGYLADASTDSTYAWNTLRYKDGQHAIQVKVTDSTNKTGQSALVSVTVRNSPTVTLINPVPDEVLSGIYTVKFHAVPVAPSVITKREIYIDGGYYADAATDTIYRWNTLNFNDGKHTIQVKATDSTGRVGYSALVSVAVNDFPTVSITSPVPDTTITGTFIIQFVAQAVAPSILVVRNIFIDGGIAGSSTTDSTYIWNTINLNDGQHTIQVWVMDSTGRTAKSDVISVTVFNTPVVKIYAPSDTALLYGTDTVKFTVDYAPGTSRDTTEISFNGVTWKPTTDTSSHVWITTDYLDGSHTTQVRAKATNGKTGYSQVCNYKVNNTPIASITAPAPGEALNGVYTVRFTVFSLSKVPMVKRQVSIDGGNWTDSLVDTATYPMNTKGWQDGTHSIQVRGYDNKGRIGYSTIRNFVVDNAPPVLADPKVVYPDNAEFTKINSDILITVLAKDVQVGLKADSGVVLRSDNIDTAGKVTYIMRDDGKGGDAVACDNVFTAKVKVTTNITGTIGYSITGCDKLNNAVTIVSAVMLDNTPPAITAYQIIPAPEVTVNPPGKRTYFDKLIMKGGYVDRGGSGVSRAFISIKNDSGNNVQNSPIELSSKDSLFSRILNLVSGKNFITLFIKDCAGNTSSRLDTLTYIESKATQIVDKNGGTVQCPNGVSVVIPAHALLNPVEITITRGDPTTEPQPLDKNTKLLNVPYRFGPEGQTFRKPVTITLSYTDADLDKNQDGKAEFDPNKFILVFWNGETWLNAGKPGIDTANRLVSVAVNHFTVFDIAQKDSTAISDLVVYWTHNPIKASQGSYCMYRIPEPGTVNCAILDMTGDIVCQLVAKGTPVEKGSYSVGWRGQNVADRFAGVGLYVYLFTYTKASDGSKTIIRKPIGLMK